MINKPVKDTWDHLKNYKDWIAEPKLDGCRITIQNGKLVRDNGLIKNEQFPELIPIIEKLPENVILDAELCIPNADPFTADFNKLQHRVNLKNKLKIKLLQKQTPAALGVFDILHDQDEDTTKLSHQERMKILHDTLTSSLKTTDFVNLYPLPQFKPAELFPKVEKYSMEGIVLKNPNSTYRSNWVKMKAEYEIDCNVVGFTSETRMISALELEDKKGNYVGKVNYQLEQTQEMAKKLVGMIAVVTYNRLTKDGKLVFPVLKELRSK